MDPNKGLLVPVSYMGKWEKCDDGCWKYDGLFTKFVRLKETTTYSELVDMICAAVRISRDENIVEVHGWMSYPANEVMPPFLMTTDVDISTFIELNSKRDCTLPLCITTSLKPKVHIASQPQTTALQKQKVHVDLSLVKYSASNSVNFPEGIPSIWKEDIKEEENSSNNESNYDDKDGDGYITPDSFDDEDEDDSYDSYVRRDPFERAIDSYYRAHLKSLQSASINPLGNQGSAPPKAENPKSINEFQFTPSDVQQKCSFGDENTPMRKGIKRGRDRSHGKIVLSNLQSTKGPIRQAFKVGETLKSKAEMMLRLRMMSVETNRQFKVTHSNCKRFIVVCLDKTCKWRMRGTFSPLHGGWVIRSYEKQHSCSIDSGQKCTRGIATADTIAHMVKPGENDPVHIRDMFERVYGIKVSYWKAWKAREIATELFREKSESSFMGLPSYLWLLEQANPGTYSAYQVDKNNCFEMCFVAFGPSIAGFGSCIRPVIALDTCSLKDYYKGVLFIATAIDGNNQIYPLAFGVAAIENDHAWSWFFQKLHHVVGARDDLVFISDIHPFIEKCCLQEFPNAMYGICMFHLGLNISEKYKVKAQDFLYDVAKAYMEIDFKEKMHQVRSMEKAVYDYLIDVDPSKWARCFFSARRYSIMTTKVSESMKDLLKEACELPIIDMLETIRTKIQVWIHDRLRIANNCASSLTPYAERKLGKRDDKSRHFKVHEIDQWSSRVLDGHRDEMVDIKLQTCTCNKFQLNQLPCSHAIRACRERGLSIYSVASRHYTIESLKLAYSTPLMPVRHHTEWSRLVPNDIQSVIVRPPVIGNEQGTKKNKCLADQGKAVARKRCGRCRELGHNRKTCPMNTDVRVGKHDQT